MITGDAAYPLLDWLVKSYVGTNLTPQQISFNCYHSSSRIVVENAFGRLKARWRMIQGRIAVPVQFAPRIIATCCILHNICEDEQTPEPNENASHTTDITPDILSIGDTNEVNFVRETIKQFLAQNFPLRESSRF